MAISDVAHPDGKWGGISARRPMLRTVLRYGVSTAGPVAVSGAHFLASLIFLHALPAREFGLFSFVMIVVAFGMSATASLIVVPITQNIVIGDARIRPTCFKMNWLVCLAFGILLFAALAASGATPGRAALLGLYGAAFSFRWFARSIAYIDGRVGAAITSDALYSAVLLGSLGVLVFTGRMNFAHGSETLLAAAVLAVLPFGARFFRDQFAALRAGRLRDYLPVFRDMSSWALLGVALTEITVNAHAYLVTFIAGPGSFALLALGMLLMRPASLVQSSLPDLERPAMARAIAANNLSTLSRIQRHFTYGLAAAWAANMLLCAGLLIFFPGLLLKKGYALHDVEMVAIISAAIMAVRTLRTPLAVMLQAAGEFKALAGIGATSGFFSVAATLILLLAFGPVASLGGIVLGELVIVLRIYPMARNWKRAQREAAPLV
jgi:O-antigen/teichoic acid export membrane protein